MPATVYLILSYLILSYPMPAEIGEGAAQMWQVAGDLSAEIGEECSKFGEVLRVTVYEIPAADKPAPEEAVRIFVKFSKQAAAMKAYFDLDGRFFGGRTVWVAFFSEAEFDADALQPTDKEPR